MLDTLKHIPTPAYIADMAAIKRNLEVARKLKQETGCKLLLATKACSMFSLFPTFAKVLDGTTASGFYEAKLGHDHFGGEVHAYSPAYSDAEIEQLLPICKHIYFNSEAQIARFAAQFSSAKIGLRLNPQFSQVTNADIYDPSSTQSRFGMQLCAFTDELMRKVDILHVHNLCENMAEDSIALIDWLMHHAAHLLNKVSAVNLGGGHYLTHAGYDLNLLISKINELKNRFNIEVILESGGAWAYDAGYLVSTVLDIIQRPSLRTGETQRNLDPSSASGLARDDENSSHEPAQADDPIDRSGTEWQFVENNIAILDTSATCHMPDVLEMPYRPNVIGDAPNGNYRYQLTGRTCLTGDIIGNYAFNHPLNIGDKLIFTDMLQYSMVKNTTFNGVPLPDIGLLEEDGTYRIIKQFGYMDFESRLS